MSNVIIFDFEVFKHDVLLGAILPDSDKFTYYQTWDKEEIKKFYLEHKDNSIWVGHNNSGYDNFILQAIVNDKDPKVVSDDIIKNHNVYRKLNIKLYFYDLMSIKMTGLKTIEAFEGKNISETEVDFDLDRSLIQEEREKTESYNRDDLDQTYADFIYLKDNFELRLTLLKEFNLPLDYLNFTEAMLASKVLHAKRINGIEYNIAKPILYDNLRVSNQDLIDFYMNSIWNEKDENGKRKTFSITLCGTKHKVAAGGIHGALENCQFKEALYIDVSGYYNLIMINYNLLPRSIPQEGKELYEYLYHEQLKMKKTNPKMRQVFKVILLAVFGAQNNDHSDFYDPSQGDLVRLTGQMFLVDLLEKLEGKIILVQSNTDGIIVVPTNGNTKEDIISVAKDWMDRTGFQAKIENIYDIIQRDVNNYMYRTDKGEIETRGEALKHYGGENKPFDTDGYMSKEPLIIPKCIVEYFMDGKSPEEVIEENKSNLKLFQYICKRNTFDWMEYEKIDNDSGNIISKKIQHVNRAFAWNDENYRGMVYKYKENGKKQKVSNLPDSVFVYNNEINSIKSSLVLRKKINYNYYIKRAYERILEFLE